MASSYQDLKILQQSFERALDVYHLCRQLPQAEQFGLTSQLQRCAVSIPSNIAEGHDRNGPKEFKQFLGIARGSAAELHTQLLLAQSIYNLDTTLMIERVSELQRMIYSLQTKLQTIN